MTDVRESKCASGGAPIYEKNTPVAISGGGEAVVTDIPAITIILLLLRE